MAVAGIGTPGQQRLLDARVLVVGAGGLGSAALPYLVAAGVGAVTLVDDDRVEAHNLPRQVLHGAADVGRPKTDSAADRLRALAPDATLTLVTERLTAATASALLPDCDLVLDCTDNVPTRLALADAAAAAGVPVVWGAVAGAAGQVTVFDAARGFALRDLWPDAPAPARIDRVGAFGPLVGTIGALMASEALKLLTGAGTPLLGRILYVDALAGTTAEIPLRPRPVEVDQEGPCNA